MQDLDKKQSQCDVPASSEACRCYSSWHVAAVAAPVDADIDEAVNKGIQIA